MIKLKRIVMPTDFSDHAAEATAYACALTDRFQAELHVLHVIQDVSSELPDFGMGLAVPAFRDNLDERKERLEEAAIAGLAKVLPDGWEQGKHVILGTRFGTPFVEIIKYAREHSADLIVLGTHGRSGLQHALLGSAAEKVVRKAPCPVLTVRPAQHHFVPPAAADASQGHPQRHRKPKPAIRHAIENLYGPCPENNFPAANKWANEVDWGRVKAAVDADHPGFVWHEKNLDEEAAAESMILEVRSEMLHAAGSHE